MGLFGKDVHHFHNKTEYHDRMVPYEKTVTENRAPTDESIRIYSEMVDKARQSIISELKVEVAGIEVVGTAFVEDHMTDTGGVWKFLYKINGVERRLDVEFDRYEFREMKNRGRVFKKDVAEKLIEKISKDIATVLLSDKQTNEVFQKLIL